MKLCSRFGLAFLLIVSVSTRAADIMGKIVDLVTYNDGHSFIKLDNGPANGCSSQYYYSLGRKSLDVKAEPMLAIALAAYMSNRTVSISSTTGDCQGGQEKLINIRLLPN